MRSPRPRPGKPLRPLNDVRGDPHSSSDSHPVPADSRGNGRAGSERQITLRVAGRSQGKARARFDPGTGHAYTPASNIIAETDVRQVWREAGEPRIEGKAAIAIDITITVVRPKGHFKKDGNLSAEGERNPHPVTKKPDVDNALKLVMDALNSRAYHDDVQVTRATVERVWGEWPETLIVLSEREQPAGPIARSADGGGQ